MGEARGREEARANEPAAPAGLDLGTQQLGGERGAFGAPAPEPGLGPGPGQELGGQGEGTGPGPGTGEQGGAGDEDFLDFLDAEALEQLERAEARAQAARQGAGALLSEGGPPRPLLQRQPSPQPPPEPEQQQPSDGLRGMTLAERRRQLSSGAGRAPAPPPALPPTMQREVGLLHSGPADRVPQRTLESLWSSGAPLAAAGLTGTGVLGPAPRWRPGPGQFASGDPPPAEAEGGVRIDEAAATHWVYPQRPPRRDYQFSICSGALLRNTLVCLPTGLGKTLIAAVVMYNFYRWFPGGKIVFVAPTKPLVHQQVQACHRVMGIPSAHTAEITGATKAEDRALWYKHCRVFFATPQTVQNDVRHGLLPAAQVVCLVVDECHRAVGRYASAGLVADLRAYGGDAARFRVLGLSATPGSSHEAVQQVISNLNIARVEFREDTDPDVAPFTHPRLLEKVVVRASGSLAECREKLLRSLESAVTGLADRGLAFGANGVENLNRFVFIQAQKALRANPGLASRGRADTAPGGLAAAHLLLEQAMLLSSLREQLDLHGAEVAWQYLQSQQSRNGLRRLREECQPFKSFYARLEHIVSQGAYNPKVEELKNILKENLVAERGAAEQGRGGGGGGGMSESGGSAGAAIVFTTLRNSVGSILKGLKGEPGLRAQAFVGQGGSRGRSESHGTPAAEARKGMSQKQQKEVLKNFREGKFNVLVATCVAEEGLDIPEVSLIVCFDTSASPGRNTQRIGRTGRHGQGKVVYLLSAGKEEKDYGRNQALTKRLQKHLRSGGQNFDLSRQSPRMVPHRFSPICKVEDIQVSQGAHGNPLLRSLQNSLWKNAEALRDISNAFKGHGMATPEGAALAGGVSDGSGGEPGSGERESLSEDDSSSLGDIAAPLEGPGRSGTRALPGPVGNRDCDHAVPRPSPPPRLPSLLPLPYELERGGAEEESDEEESDVPLPLKRPPPAPLEALPVHRSSGRIPEFAKRYYFDCPELEPGLRDTIGWERDGTLHISEPQPGDWDAALRLSSVSLGGGGGGETPRPDKGTVTACEEEDGGDLGAGNSPGGCLPLAGGASRGAAGAHMHGTVSSGSDAFEERGPASLRPLPGPEDPDQPPMEPSPAQMPPPPNPPPPNPPQPNPPPSFLATVNSPRTPAGPGVGAQQDFSQRTPATLSSLEALVVPRRAGRTTRWAISESPEDHPAAADAGRPSLGSGSGSWESAIPARRTRRDRGPRVLRESDEFRVPSPRAGGGGGGGGGSGPPGRAKKRPCLFIDDEAEASDEVEDADLPSSLPGSEPRRTSLDDFIVPTQTETTPLTISSGGRRRGSPIDMRAVYQRGGELLTPGEHRGRSSLPAFGTPLFRGGTKMRFQGAGLLNAMMAEADIGEDGNEDCCRVCGEPGELLLCDRCPAGFHLRCLGLQTLPSQTQWFCPDCAGD